MTNGLHHIRLLASDDCGDRTGPVLVPSRLADRVAPEYEQEAHDQTGCESTIVRGVM